MKSTKATTATKAFVTGIVGMVGTLCRYFMLFGGRRPHKKFSTGGAITPSLSHTLSLPGGNAHTDAHSCTPLVLLVTSRASVFLFLSFIWVALPGVQWKPLRNDSVTARCAETIPRLYKTGFCVMNRFPVAFRLCEPYSI